MLQQTTVEVVGPYFERFVKRFPGARALAAAPERDVLALWSGLGYYHRARSLLRTARLIRRRHGGRIPRDPAALRALPGIGPYTAGAILSIGHDLPHPAIDGNVMRVVARLGAIRGDPASASTRREVERLAAGLMPRDRAGDFNQALMDLGAGICAPRNPRCPACPLRADCRARARGLVGAIPPPSARAEAVPVDLVAVAARHGGRTLLVRREGGTLMRGVWEFPTAPGSGAAHAERLARGLGLDVTRPLGEIRHTITRHRIRVAVFEARPVAGAAPRRARGGLAIPDGGGEGPAARLATRPGPGRVTWAAIDGTAFPGDGRLPLSGAARKIAGLLVAHGGQQPRTARRARRRPVAAT